MSAQSLPHRTKPARRHGVAKDTAAHSLKMAGMRSAYVSEHMLGLALLDALRGDLGVTGVEEFPEAFEWIDGADGRDHFRMPIALIHRGPRDLAYVDAKPRAALLRDPELGGARKRMELECAARGASYEVWTEDEISMDLSVVQVLRVADARERLAYREAFMSRASPWPQVVGTVAERLYLEHPREVGGGWIGRSRLTGIPMALLGDLEVDSETRMAVWRPRRSKFTPSETVAPGEGGIAGLNP